MGGRGGGGAAGDPASPTLTSGERRGGAALLGAAPGGCRAPGLTGRGCSGLGGGRGQARAAGTGTSQLRRTAENSLSSLVPGRRLDLGPSLGG